MNLKKKCLSLTTNNDILPHISQYKTNHSKSLFHLKEKTFRIDAQTSFKQLIRESNIENDKNIKKSSSRYEGKCVLCSSGVGSHYPADIRFVANKMDRYLQFSTKSIARAILFSIF